MSAKKVLIKIIRIYQVAVSPDHSFIGKFFPFLGCRFYPSCSEYTAQAIDLYGAKQGIWIGIKRVLRCHPWSEGGIDYPNKVQNHKSKI